MPDPKIDELALDSTFLDRAREAHALDAEHDGDADEPNKPLTRAVMVVTCMWCGSEYITGYGAFCSRRCADAEVRS